MVMLKITQGTTDWYVQRLWRLTASSMKASITSKGSLSRSKAAIAHIDKLISGIELASIMTKDPKIVDGMDDREFKRFMADYTGDTFHQTLHTERGHELEADAIAAVSQKIGVQLHDVGMCVMGDEVGGFVSCSPDAFDQSAGRMIAGAEVKSQCYFKYISQVEAGVLPADHTLQVHASMAVCDVDLWHFGSYFVGNPIFYVPVKRDHYTDAISASLLEFKDLYAERLEAVNFKLDSLRTQKVEGLI